MRSTNLSKSKSSVFELYYWIDVFSFFSLFGYVSWNLVDFIWRKNQLSRQKTRIFWMFRNTWNFFGAYMQWKCFWYAASGFFRSFDSFPNIDVFSKAILIHKSYLIISFKCILLLEGQISIKLSTPFR